MIVNKCCVMHSRAVMSVTDSVRIEARATTRLARNRDFSHFSTFLREKSRFLYTQA